MIFIRRTSFILLTIGLLIAAIPVVGRIYSGYQQDRMLDDWLNDIDTAELENMQTTDMEAAYAQLQEAFISEAGSNQSYSSDVDGPDYLESGYAAPAPADTDDGGVHDTGGTASDGREGSGAGTGSANASGKGVTGQKVIGVIKISSIDVEEPIVEGVSKSNLRAAIGHFPGTAAPGQNGNCALAGHRSYAFNKLFNRLDELKIGDEINIATKEEDLIYKVIETKEVDPDDVSVLKGSKDKNVITLITCTPKYIASHRLIVTAELTERAAREP